MDVAHTWFSMKRAPQNDLSTFEIYTGDDCPGYSASGWTKVVEMKNKRLTTNVGKDKFNELFNKCGVVRYTRGRTTSVYKR